jgi:electron transfer flavoprotein beta subunit
MSNPLNIVVCAKQVFFSGDLKLVNGKISEKGVDFETNEWDKYAIEEALLLKEKHGGTVTVVTIGPDRTERVLREALALGVDDVVRIWDEAFNGSDSFAVARILASYIRTLDFDLVLTGAQDGEDGYGVVGPTLGGVLGFSWVTLVTGLTVNQSTALVSRELEDNMAEQLEVDLPAVLTIQTGINTLRYPSLGRIRRAMKRNIKVLDLERIGLQASDVGLTGSRSKIEKISIPEISLSSLILEGKPIEAVDKLVQVLQTKGIL